MLKLHSLFRSSKEKHCNPYHTCATDYHVTIGNLSNNNLTSRVHLYRFTSVFQAVARF